MKNAPQILQPAYVSPLETELGTPFRYLQIGNKEGLLSRTISVYTPLENGTQSAVHIFEYDIDISFKLEGEEWVPYNLSWRIPKEKCRHYRTDIPFKDLGYLVEKERWTVGDGEVDVLEIESEDDPTINQILTAHFFAYYGMRTTEIIEAAKREMESSGNVFCEPKQNPN